MRLRAGELCPLHGGHYGCCGREKYPSLVNKRLGLVTRLPDGREICSAAEMRQRLLKKIKQQNGLCADCGKPFADVRDAVVDYIVARGMGTGSRDDRMSNLHATHERCSIAKGSLRR